MDGYPGSARQAELLEGSLTGLDLASERALVAQASRLAPPPQTSLPDLNRFLASGTTCSAAVLPRESAFELSSPGQCIAAEVNHKCSKQMQQTNAADKSHTDHAA